MHKLLHLIELVSKGLESGSSKIMLGLNMSEHNADTQDERAKELLPTHCLLETTKIS